jgi:hypothetical protein
MKSKRSETCRLLGRQSIRKIIRTATRFRVAVYPFPFARFVENTNG